VPAKANGLKEAGCFFDVALLPELGGWSGACMGRATRRCCGGCRGCRPTLWRQMRWSGHCPPRAADSAHRQGFMGAECYNGCRVLRQDFLKTLKSKICFGLTFVF
jgi:hypothetical protein